MKQESGNWTSVMEDGWHGGGEAMWFLRSVWVGVEIGGKRVEAERRGLEYFDLRLWLRGDMWAKKSVNDAGICRGGERCLAVVKTWHEGPQSDVSH